MHLFTKEFVKEGMKKYLLLIEDEGLWAKFKEVIDKDINTEILGMIKLRVKNGKVKNDAKK